MKEKRTLADLVISIGAVVLGLVVYYLSQDLITASLGLGADGWPRMLGIAFMIMGGFQLIVTLKDGVKIEAVSVDIKAMLPTILTVSTSIAYVFLLNSVGFLLLSPILMFLTMIYFGYRKYLFGAALSVVFPTALYFVFSKVFLISLPAGSLIG
ncbi:MAG: tripartite tricarboxylate transporter TctB family protein [Eubacteriales bacterium]